MKLKVTTRNVVFFIAYLCKSLFIFSVVIVDCDKIFFSFVNLKVLTDMEQALFHLVLLHVFYHAAIHGINWSPLFLTRRGHIMVFLWLAGFILCITDSGILAKIDHNGVLLLMIMRNGRFLSSPPSPPHSNRSHANSQSSGDRHLSSIG